MDLTYIIHLPMRMWCSTFVQAYGRAKPTQSPPPNSAFQQPVL